MIKRKSKTKPKANKFDGMFQSVWITFSDGMSAAFSGQAVVGDEDEARLKIVDIKFTGPKPLPPGYSLEAIPSA